MYKLDKFLLKSYIGPFILTFFISLFVLLMQFLWKYVDDLVGKGFDFGVIAELMFYASATFVPMALPLAVLLSSLMTFGNLGESYELVAMKSSGISLQRIIRPLVVFIIMLSGSAFYFSNFILPKANLEFYSLLRDVRHQKPAVSIEEGVFNSDIGNFIIKVGKKNPDGAGIEDVIIYNHTQNTGNKNITLADAGRMEMTDDKKYLILTLFDGVNYNENIANDRKKHELPMQITHFKKEVQRVNLAGFNFKKSDRGLMRNNYQMLNVNQLEYFEDSLTIELDSMIDGFVDYVDKDLSYLNLYNISLEEKQIRRGEDKVLKDSLDRLINGDSNVLVAEKSELDKSSNKLVSKSTKKKKNSEINSKIDEYPPLKEEFIENFDSLTQVRVVVGALSLARNASYQTKTSFERINAKSKFLAKFKVEWHRKFTLSIACIILFFIGAPLGAIIRKGGLGTPLVISILMFVLYHVFTIIGEKSVKSQVMEPWFGMWMASFIYLPIGIFLTWKATTDAPLLDSEAWHKFFSRFNIIAKLKKRK